MADPRLGGAGFSQGARADWLVGGGEMAKVIKAKDWSETALGSIVSWPQSLRTTVSLAQASNSPISLSWGAGHVQIYNDGYWPICGAKHPASMGQDFRECWASAFPVIGEAYETAWTGKSGYLEKMRMFLDRYGFLEETWFTFSFRPLTDESGRVGGLFHPVTEMTSQMLSERRTRTLRDLASRASKAKTSADAFALTAQALEEASFDLPFVLLYELDSERRTARLVGQTGIAPGTAVSPERVDVATAEDGPWPIAEVARTGVGRQVDDAERILAGRLVGPYPELPKTAFVLPVATPGHDAPAAVIVAGVSARLHLSDPYRNFFDLVGASLSTSLANARAYENERRRAEELAEIDRAKTAFFSNVSHEFRTPLTLILGPLEDAVARGAAGLEGDALRSVHRNALRLLRLVNSLLDFSRVEAGRLRASPEPTDLSALTAGLADSFRSLVESAGLELVIDCPPLPASVAVDRAHWEKIVLNLLSNAFKFTFHGSITVRIRAEDGRATLAISDTGTGIPEGELARVFERFHRVEGASGRSFEGTGIGLALVQELARHNGGSVSVESVLDRGSTFKVSLPLAEASGLVAPSASERPTPSATSRSPYLLEAEQWRGVEMRPPANEPDGAPVRAPGPDPSPAPEPSGRVLVVDDNSDMRQYVVRLLEPRFTVDDAADGVAALERIRERVPDLVLTDVMMPRMDGFGLLRAIREDPATSAIPVVLLSARAGEEAVVGGLESGADDYLVKPFSARELIVRVRTHLELARTRREARDAAVELAQTRAVLLADVERKNKELEAFSYSVSHDLRAPLRSIDGFSHALLEDCADRIGAKGVDHLRRVQGAARRMGELIDDLMKLSRVERSAMRRERVDLSHLGRRVGDLLARGDPARSVSLSVEDGLAADVDARLAEILLENLLANAWKFTGGAASASIEFRSLREPASQVFYVRDNGVGFDAAHAARLFTPFHRLHSDAEFPGTGIGLATVHRIVDRHGGRIWADGVVGRGATFFFTLRPDK